MKLSKSARRGIAIFSRIQMKTPKHLAPKLTPHEKAMKMNERFDKEKARRNK